MDKGWFFIGIIFFIGWVISKIAIWITNAWSDSNWELMRKICLFGMGYSCLMSL